MFAKGFKKKVLKVSKPLNLFSKGFQTFKHFFKPRFKKRFKGLKTCEKRFKGLETFKIFLNLWQTFKPFLPRFKKV